MRRVITIGVLALAVLVAAASATVSGSIVASWRSPCRYAFGLDYYDGCLYHTGQAESVIYATNTAGSILGITPDPSKAYGVDRTANEFWTAPGVDLIYRLATTGSVIRSLPAPGYAGYGVTFGEGCLWYSTYTTAPYIYRLTVDGSVMSSFRSPGRATGGLFWEAPTLWFADCANPSGSIYHVTTNGSIIESITVPGARPLGVARQGPFVWYTDINTRFVYQVTYTQTELEPASLGRVKALYR